MIFKKSLKCYAMWKDNQEVPEEQDDHIQYSEKSILKGKDQEIKIDDNESVDNDQKSE